MIDLNIGERLSRLVSSRGDDSPETCSGVVSRTDQDGTIWVRFAGSESDTPCTSTTVKVSDGDRVSVTTERGSARIVGNLSSPSTDDSTANIARTIANAAAEGIDGLREIVSENTSAISSVSEATDEANKVAAEAQAVAEATGQHFFTDTDGVHVTEAEGDATTGHNILINALGILLRHAANYLTSITASAIAFYDGAGTAASNIVAQFGAALARIGYAAGNHVDITNSGIDFSMPYDDGNGHTGTASASMSAGYGTYTDRSGTQNTTATFNITHGSTDLTMYNNGHANLASDLEVDNLEVMGQANVGDTLMVGATHNVLADTVVVNGGSVSVGTITNNATPSVSLDDSNNAVSFIISGSNRGIYDTTNSKWIVYSGSDNVTVSNGLAASASGTSTNANNYWTFINANTGVGVRFVLNPNSRNLVVMYTLNGGSSWSSTKTVASWS